MCGQEGISNLWYSLEECGQLCGLGLFLTMSRASDANLKLEPVVAGTHSVLETVY